MGWEYKVFSCDVGRYYDELLELWLKPAGDDGWELVHISERPGANNNVLHLKAYCKRPTNGDWIKATNPEVVIECRST